MNLVDLDSATRAYMRAEVERDIAAGTLYASDRLNSAGLRQYPIVLWTRWTTEPRPVLRRPSGCAAC